MSSDNEISFAPTLAQEKFMLSDAYVRLLAGPIGGGKSVTCVHELIRWSTEQNPNKDGIRKTRFLIVRNTVDQLKSTTLKTVFDWIPPSWAGTWSVTDKTFYIRFGLPDGTTVETEWLAMPLDTPDDVRKALSLEVTGLWGNESRELHPDVVDGLLMRVNRYPSMKDGGPTRPGAIFDTNMPQMSGWWFEKMSNPPANWSIHIQPPAVLTLKEWQDKYGTGKHKWTRGQFKIWASSNSSGQISAYAERPGAMKASLVGTDVDHNTYVIDHEADNFQNLNPSYYPNTLEGKTQEFINVYLRCMFGQSKEGRPVFEGFKRSFHVAENQLIPIEDPNRPLIVGMDFGLTPACTISQVDPRGRLMTFAELTSSNMGIYRFINEKLQPLLSERFGGLQVIVVGDPAGTQRSQTKEETVYDILEDEGFVAQPAPTNALDRRLMAVEMFLSRVVDGTPAHLIDPSCATLIGAMSGGYRYRMKKTGDMEDKPEKNDYSHLMDGHQYACLYVNSGMAPGGRLQSRKGQRREIKTVQMGAWM
ncbi:MAG: hypothetical protein FKY71_16640 [Spiribacter salinus]|uniref:Terminase n=1 Tax=Spiribacter salinus TaxID=1335746 RepID=A0A540VIA1_9GAMM|nr:MAG: hypothetical protein FKY71_16640 [Spiribacter salinus]